MSLENQLIFLAGSTGLAGSSILEYLVQNYPETKIRAIYHKRMPFFRHNQIEYVQGDLTSIEDCKKLADGCDCAIMAAAYTGGAGFVRSFPLDHVNENLLMIIQMLRAFHLKQVKRVVYIGSATLYQDFEGCIKEEELDLNRNPHEAYFGFGWMVRFIEKLCCLLHEQDGTELVVARAANIFGPYANFDPKTSNFIPAIIRKAVEKMDPFEVWGTPDVTRDVIYTSDFAKAIVLMADDDKIKFDTFNVGSGMKTTVGDVVHWVLQYARHHPDEIKYLQDRPTTMKFRVLDCTKLKETLGWKPEYTIEEGIKKTVEWWIENRNWWNK